MRERDVTRLGQSWQIDDRWEGVQRPYSAKDVVRLQGAVKIEYTMARLGAERLWTLLHTEPYVRALARRPGPRPCKWSRPV